MSRQTGEDATLPAKGLARKKPPPEKPEAIRLRTKVIFSFWAVIVCLGLPTWLQTTSIYRARLPLQEMLNWADGLNHQPILPLNVWITGTDVSDKDVAQIARETQQAIDDLNEFPALHLRLRQVLGNQAGKSPGQKGDYAGHTVRPDDPEPALKINLRKNTDQYDFDIRAGDSLVAGSNLMGQLPTVLAKHLHAIVSDEQTAVAHQYALKGINSHNPHAFLRAASHETIASIQKRAARAFKTSPEYHLTFSLFTAGGSPSSWEIEAALNDQIRPLLRALSYTASFSLATQVQLYSAFSPSIQTRTFYDRTGSFLHPNDLTAFVNAAEWPLAPSVGSGPTMNFILYTPLRDQVPLTIGNDQAESWLIPQWGAIKILNPSLVPHPETGTDEYSTAFGQAVISGLIRNFSIAAPAAAGCAIVDDLQQTNAT